MDVASSPHAAEDITSKVVPTWSHCARIGGNPLLRVFLPLSNPRTRSFVRAFPRMVEAYARGAMVFGLFAARKAV